MKKRTEVASSWRRAVVRAVGASVTGRAVTALLVAGAAAMALATSSAEQARGGAPAFPPNNPEGAAIEQRAPGTRDAAELAASFDGLGVGFDGPQGVSAGRNPSDNSLAVGPDHILQTVNTRMAIFTKKGKNFDTTGKILYGAVPNNTVFKGFGGTCEERNNGDTVVRYDQLADRWLIVMPIFRRAAERPDQPPLWTPSSSAYVSPPGVAGQPGPAAPLFVPPPAPPEAAPPQAPAQAGRQAVRQPARSERPARTRGEAVRAATRGTGSANAARPARAARPDPAAG